MYKIHCYLEDVALYFILLITTYIAVVRNVILYLIGHCHIGMQNIKTKIHITN
jgi:hypothetical protein